MKDLIKREQNKPVCSAEREIFRTMCKMKKVFKKVFLTVMALRVVSSSHHCRSSSLLVPTSSDGRQDFLQPCSHRWQTIC